MTQPPKKCRERADASAFSMLLDPKILAGDQWFYTRFCVMLVLWDVGAVGRAQSISRLACQSGPIMRPCQKSAAQAIDDSMRRVVHYVVGDG